MKPIGLMSYPIRNSTMTNGIVLDPFLGSGSTLIACEETDRVCRGIELAESLVQKYGEGVVFVNKVVINDMDFEHSV